MKTQLLQEQISAAAGNSRPQTVLKNALVINVFTNSVEKADIAINNGIIVGLGDYSGEHEIDLGGQYVCPGFIDGHIHLESSMVRACEFEKAVLPHGTTCVITDPHEISNVAGLAGLDFMLEETKALDLDVFFMLPSCVPSTGIDEAGAVITAADMEPYLNNPRVLGLAEMMNAPGVLAADSTVLDKLAMTHAAGKRIDGHAPFLAGKELNAYITAGVGSDHECSDIDEAMEKLRRGQYIMVREGTAAQNMQALLPLFAEPYCNRAMLVTDDKHPGDLIAGGHIDYIIRSAIAAGVDPTIAVKMGTLIPAQYFGLKNRGAVAPGFVADLVVVDSLDNFGVTEVYKGGKPVARQGSCCDNAPVEALSLCDANRRVLDSFRLHEVTEQDFELEAVGQNERVIWLTPHELLTKEVIVPFASHQGFAPGVDIEQDIVKVAVFERHHNTGHVGLGFLGGYGLRNGAVASSVAHDSHNLIVVGTNHCDMAAAANAVRECHGGLAFAVDGVAVSCLPLPIAGLMSDCTAAEVEAALQGMKHLLHGYGVAEEIDAFMTLSFASLPVIPKLRLTTRGIVDVDSQQVVPAIF